MNPNLFVNSKTVNEIIQVVGAIKDFKDFLEVIFKKILSKKYLVKQLKIDSNMLITLINAGDEYKEVFDLYIKNEYYPLQTQDLQTLLDYSIKNCTKERRSEIKKSLIEKAESLGLKFNEDRYNFY